MWKLAAQVNVFMVMTLLPLMAHSVTYMSPMGDSQWQVDSSIFECRLTHPIEYYGDAVFTRRAGEAQGFHLLEKTARMKTGKALLTSENPLWKPYGQAADFGLTPVAKGDKPLKLNEKMSQKVLMELHQGMRMVVTRKPWYGAENSMRIAMQPVNFRPAYREYLDCQASLLPVNFDQIARTAIYFPLGHDELAEKEKRKLDNIVLYVKADPSVSGYVIDGHTDGLGGRADNLQLSQRRAEMVAAYLTTNGVDSDKISVRWHGERYPVASNRNRKGRAQNRRVTIRLDKGDMPTMPVASKKQELASVGG